MMQSIVPHAFGQHGQCGNWCGFVKRGDSYRHSALPNDFEGLQLRESLSKVFATLADKSVQIAPSGSTRENESMNNVVSSEAPKS